MYKPELKSNEAIKLYSAMLDYFFFSDDPAYSKLHQFRNKIVKIELGPDKVEMIKYFESEAGQSIGYYNTPY